MRGTRNQASALPVTTPTAEITHMTQHLSERVILTSRVSSRGRSGSQCSRRALRIQAVALLDTLLLVISRVVSAGVVTEAPK
jgi:hypothetical protein